MGIETSMPVFISPAAMAKLGHPLGEVNLTRAADDWDVVQAVSLPSLNKILHKAKSLIVATDILECEL